MAQRENALTVKAEAGEVSVQAKPRQAEAWDRPFQGRNYAADTWSSFQSLQQGLSVV